MRTNELPNYDATDNPTGCCPRFDPEGWDDRELHFENKLFVEAKTRSLAHIPLNMGSVFRKTFDAVETANARSDDDFIVMSHDESAWSARHLFSVTHEVPGQTTVRLSGDYVTKVYEGPYRKVPTWEKEMTEDLHDRGETAKRIYFFYTTCPKCARHYGKNFVVAVAEV